MEALVYIIVGILSVTALIAIAVKVGIKKQAKQLDVMLREAEQEHVYYKIKHLRSMK